MRERGWGGRGEGGDWADMAGVNAAGLIMIFSFVRWKHQSPR